MPLQSNYEDCVIAGQLSPEENLKIYQEKRIFRKVAGNAIPQKNPVAIILGGQNASGKSTLGEQFFTQYKKYGGIVRVEGDALRDYHPKFNQCNLENDKLMAAYTARDSGVWTRRLIEDAGRSRMNMLIETTMRSPEIVCETARRLTEGGYDVQTKVVVVSYDKSLVGAYYRYETLKADRGAGRFVHDHALKAAYNGMPKTLQALKEQGRCSCLHLYTREQPLFEGDYRKADIIDMVRQERCRAYTPAEIKSLQDDWKKVGEYMLSRNAGKEEFEEIKHRMKERIDAATKEGVAQENIHVLINISNEIL